jgi:hypothetical protein
LVTQGQGHCVTFTLRKNNVSCGKAMPDFAHTFYYVNLHKSSSSLFNL